jgi:hypothetical protein
MAYEITDELKSVVLHTLAATAIGIVSIQFEKYISFVIGGAVLFGLSLFVKYVLKKKETKWWLGNGLWPFLITWLAVWTIAMNL